MFEPVISCLLLLYTVWLTKTHTQKKANLQNLYPKLLDASLWIKWFFVSKWAVCRHLQDQHSGICYQCTICKQIYFRRSIAHCCGATDRDFVFLHGESGKKGLEARKMLENFINSKMDTLWKYVECSDFEESYVRSVRYSPSPNWKANKT